MVKIGNNLSEKFKIQKGLKEDVIAPLLFNIALEIAIQKSKINTNGTFKQAKSAVSICR